MWPGTLTLAYRYYPFGSGGIQSGPSHMVRNAGTLRPLAIMVYGITPKLYAVRLAESLTAKASYLAPAQTAVSKRVEGKGGSRIFSSPWESRLSAGSRCAERI